MSIAKPCKISFVYTCIQRPCFHQTAYKAKELNVHIYAELWVACNLMSLRNIIHVDITLTSNLILFGKTLKSLVLSAGLRGYGARPVVCLIVVARWMRVYWVLYMEFYFYKLPGVIMSEMGSHIRFLNKQMWREKSS